MKAFFENIVLKYQRQVICLGIFLVNRNDWRFSVIRAGVRHHEITLISSVENLKDLNEVMEIFHSDAPVILHIDGWGVLIKEKGTENNSIPSGNNEFYIKEYLNQDGKEPYISVIRTDLLKSILSYCNSLLIKVTGVYFGPFCTALVSAYFDEGATIKAGKWKFSLNNGRIGSLTAEGLENQIVYNIGGEHIKSGILPLYAAAAAFFSGERDNNEMLKGSREEFIYGKLVKYLGAGSLALILFLLLINYFSWESLRSRNNELTFEVRRNERILAELAEKEKDLKEKEALVVRYIGTDERSDFSWYADRLGSLLPSGIRLTRMAIQPLNKKQKPGIAVEYMSRQIDVEGDVGKMPDISEWVKLIDQEKWVKKVELISFFSDKEKSSGHFKLQIKY